MKLWAISDLHLGHAVTRRALLELPPHRDDWLILAGDVGETEAQLRFALETLVPRFEKLVWVPGNHDLWSPEGDPGALRGDAKYRRLVTICRDYGALTPEADVSGGTLPETLAPLTDGFCRDPLPVAGLKSATRFPTKKTCSSLLKSALTSMASPQSCAADSGVFISRIVAKQASMTRTVCRCAGRNEQ